MLKIKDNSVVDGFDSGMEISKVVEIAEDMGYDIELRFVAKGKAPVTDSVHTASPRYEKQYLYKLTFPDGKVYIGTAFDIKKRWANKGGGYRGQKVWEAIRKFGWENITKEILMYIPSDTDWLKQSRNTDKIRARERELIAEYDGRSYNSQCTRELSERISAIGYERGYYNPRIYWEVDGVRRPAKDWCVEYGVSFGKTQNRIHKWGLTPKQALTFPPVPNRDGYAKDPLRYWRDCGCFDEK